MLLLSIVVDIEEGEQHGHLTIAVLDLQDTEIHKGKLPVLLKTAAADTRDIVIASIDNVDRSRDGLLKNILKPKGTLMPQRKKVVSKKTTA